jgi:hypothetical protein
MKVWNCKPLGQGKIHGLVRPCQVHKCSTACKQNKANSAYKGNTTEYTWRPATPVHPHTLMYQTTA